MQSEHAVAALNTAVDQIIFLDEPLLAGDPSVRGMFSWCCITAFADACTMSNSVAREPCESASEEEQRQCAGRALQLAAASLKFLHLLALERDNMGDIFVRGEFQPFSGISNPQDAIAQTCRAIATAVADMEALLAPALAPVDAPGL